MTQKVSHHALWTISSPPLAHYMHLCSRLPLEMRHIQRKLSSFPVGHSFIIQFKPGNSPCAVDYVNATATQIEEGVWNVTTDSGASKTYPSEEEIE